ncbi:molybdopterin-binding/glycosyltransferase family 2 protein [Fulvimarina sp. MAC8]|uniref:molybdopterin-binding/glycosyltransferase family 2 protein n=1 Tax=Fulvimarina sp. MAC8 TaxID=3162874 RepID=UPI0032EF9C0E
MRFGEIAIDEADGAILAHAAKSGTLDLKKGTRLTAADIAALRDAGMTSVIAAQLDAGDVGEDEAAARIAKAMSAPHLEIGPAATGRVNIHAQRAGVFRPDKTMIDALNAVDPGITLATLGENSAIQSGQMVATIKIIPLAVSGAALDRALSVLERGTAIMISPFVSRDVAMIQTTLPATQTKMLEKTRRVTEDRLAMSGSRIVSEMRVPHRSAELSAAIAEAASNSNLVLVFGASAVIDRADVIPAAIESAGGSVDYFGMPVDPGNLLLVGRIGDTPVFGAPGCARSPKENGFDWVVDRIMAGMDVTPALLQSWGVGGLLAEIETRPRPRQNAARSKSCALDAVVLAAGRSTRMGEQNKLLAEISPGKPMVRHAVETALSAKLISKVHVVLGHQADEVRAALQGLAVEFVTNASFADGISTSLRAGFAAARDAAGVLVLLADQPLLEPSDLDRLASEFKQLNGRSIVAAADGAKRRNPVILPVRCREAVEQLIGDRGAAPIIEAMAEAPVLIDIGDAASLDTDTPERFREAKNRMSEKERRA